MIIDSSGTYPLFMKCQKKLSLPICQWQKGENLQVKLTLPRFAEGKIDTMLPNASPLVGVLLKSWEAHCKEHKLHWTLNVNEIVTSVGLRFALLSTPTTIAEGKILVIVTHLQP